MLLWKKLEDMMIDGCSRCVIIGGMSSRLNSSSSKMKKKRNVKDSINTEIRFIDSKDWKSCK